MKQFFVLLVLYTVEILGIAFIADITTLGEFDSIALIVGLLELGLLIYWTVFNLFKDTSGVEDQTSMLKINVGTMGSGKTFKAAHQAMKKAKSRWFAIRIKKVISVLLNKFKLGYFDIFYDDEEWASINHYKNIVCHYTKDHEPCKKEDKEYSYTLKGYKDNRIIPLLFSNTAMYYDKKVKVKGKFFKVKERFYSQRVEDIEDFLSPEPHIVNNWDNVDQIIKVKYLSMLRNKYPYLSVFLLDEVGFMINQWETKKRGKGLAGLRALMIEQFENFIRWIRQFGDFAVYMTDQQASDVFKGARSRVGSITLAIAQLPAGIPLLFARFAVFWQFSLYRRLYFKTQKNQDSDTSNEVVMVTRKEDLKPDRLVLSNKQFYTSRFARTMYRPLDKPEDIEYSAKPYRSEYWEPKKHNKTV